MKTIQCHGCELALPQESFTPGIWALGRGRCRPCQKTYSANHYLKNREKRIAAMRAYNMLKLYGLTPEHYELLLASQGGRCAICSVEHGWRHRQSGGPKKLAIDHCHETGRVRGLLCDRCNTAVGKLDHNPDLLRKAIDYLKRTG